MLREVYTVFYIFAFSLCLGSIIIIYLNTSSPKVVSAMHSIIISMTDPKEELNLHLRFGRDCDWSSANQLLPQRNIWMRITSTLSQECYGVYDFKRDEILLRWSGINTCRIDFF